MKVLLFILAAFTALAFSLCGVIMISYPDGSVLNLPSGLLSGSPFKNYLVPGICLTINGAVYIFALLYYMEPSGVRYNWAVSGGILTSFISLLAITFLRSFFVLEWVGLAMGIIIVLTAAYLKGKWIL